MWRRMCGCGAAVAALGLMTAGGAQASSSVVKVGTPTQSGAPAVAVSGSGTALIAWADTEPEASGADDFVQYCALPAGAKKCSLAGNLTLFGGATTIDNVQVLSDGGTLVVLADAYGAPGPSGLDYEPEQEWQSTDGGATWDDVGDGLSVADGVISADTQPLSAVIVPGTGVLGYGWDTASAAPTFNVFPLSAPPECSEILAPTGCAGGYATLEPATNPDALSNEPGQFAAQAGSSPGVMGVFETLFSSGPLGCKQSFGTAYTYGSGAQSSTNNYNLSPGQPGSAWKLALSQAACNTEYPAVGGGASGFGLLEDGLASHTAEYQRFDAATMKFGAPVAVSSAGELDGALSQDKAGGIFATYLGGAGGPVELSYSADGGSGFTTGSLQADKSGVIANLGSSVDPGGKGWAVWDDGGSVFAQPFTASDAVSPAIVSGSVSSDGVTVHLTVHCASLPCRVSVTLTATSAALHSAELPDRSGSGGQLRIATGTAALSTRGPKTITLDLSRRAKRLLGSGSGRLRVTALLSTRVQGQTVQTRKDVTVRISPATH